jgi:hypothetical protein
VRYMRHTQRRRRYQNIACRPLSKFTNSAPRPSHAACASGSRPPHTASAGREQRGYCSRSASPTGREQ